MRDITNAAIDGFGFREPQHFYYLGLAFVVLALFVSLAAGGLQDRPVLGPPCARTNRSPMPWA